MRSPFEYPNTLDVREFRRDDRPMRLATWAWLVLFACGKSAAPTPSAQGSSDPWNTPKPATAAAPNTPATGADCAKWIDGMLARPASLDLHAWAGVLQYIKLGTALPPDVAVNGSGITEEMKSYVIKVCVDDRWPEEALNCVETAKNNREWSHCTDKFTADQVTHFVNAMRRDQGSSVGCPAGMVSIPEGTFELGASGTPKGWSAPKGVTARDESPSHKVSLLSYCIDKTEVTVSAYLQCVEQGRCSSLPTTVAVQGQDADEASSAECNGRHQDRRDHPANCVDWEQANSYCTSRGKSLPTEAQWEYAAPGSDNRIFPWGDSQPSDTKFLNACDNDCAQLNSKLFGSPRNSLYGGQASDGYASTAPVGSFPKGASPFGVLDMAGNVYEWTSDWYGPYSPEQQSDPTGPDNGTEKVARGGSWYNNNIFQLRGGSRWKFPSVYRGTNLGFRCVAPTGHAQSKMGAPVSSSASGIGRCDPRNLPPKAIGCDDKISMALTKGFNAKVNVTAGVPNFEKGENEDVDSKETADYSSATTNGVHLDCTLTRDRTGAVFEAVMAIQVDDADTSDDTQHIINGAYAALAVTIGDSEQSNKALVWMMKATSISAAGGDEQTTLLGDLRLSASAGSDGQQEVVILKLSHRGQLQIKLNGGSGTRVPTKGKLKQLP